MAAGSGSVNTTLFTKVDYPLNALVQDIELGKIGLPDIQRPFVWANSKVRDLFDSMYKGFPVGYLLFWQNALSENSREIGVNLKQKTPQLLIVDGQQRLTSLFAVLKGVPVIRENYESEKISIGFNPIDETFEVADAAVRRNPEFISDISIVWKPNTSAYQLVKGYLDGLSSAREITTDDEYRISTAINRLINLQNYPFTALELFSTVDEEQVADVFVRVNSKATLLIQADFILTLMSVFWDEGRFQLENFSRASRRPTASGASPFNYFIHPDPDQLLRVSVALGFRRARLRHVYSILRGKDLETGEFSAQRRDEQFSRLKESQSYILDLQHWHDFLKSLQQAGYRDSGMISSETAVLYAYALFLIGKHDFMVPDYNLRNVIARWFFMSHMTSRYSSSPETQMEQDLADLRAVSDADGFVSLLDQIIADTLTSDYWSIALPNDLATSSSRSPSFFAYIAALNLLGARVLFSRLSVSELL